MTRKTVRARRLASVALMRRARSLGAFKFGRRSSHESRAERRRVAASVTGSGSRIAPSDCASSLFRQSRTLLLPANLSRGRRRPSGPPLPSALTAFVIVLDVARSKDAGLLDVQMIEGQLAISALLPASRY